MLLNVHLFIFFSNLSKNSFSHVLVKRFLTFRRFFNHSFIFNNRLTCLILTCNSMKQTFATCEVSPAMTLYVIVKYLFMFPWCKNYFSKSTKKHESIVNNKVAVFVAHELWCKLRDSIYSYIKLLAVLLSTSSPTTLINAWLYCTSIACNTLPQICHFVCYYTRLRGWTGCFFWTDGIPASQSIAIHRIITNFRSRHKYWRIN